MSSSVRTGSPVWDLVVDRAEATPDGLMATDEHGRSLTFIGFRDAVQRSAAGFAALGVGRGAVVSWQLPSRIETMVATCALALLGAVQNPIIMSLHEPDLEFVCRQVGTDLLLAPTTFRGYGHAEAAHAIAGRTPGLRVLVVDDDLPTGSGAAPVAAPAGPEPVRWVFYTSGTTSAPKGARHTDAGLFAAARTYTEHIRPLPEDRIAALAPIAHVGGVLHVLASLLSGAALVLTEVFEPASTARQLREAGMTYGGNGTPFVQAFLRLQRERPGEPLFPDLKAFLIGGAPRPAGLHGEVRAELGGAGIASGYGLTECPFFAWAAPDDGDAVLATTEGRPGPGGQTLIVRPDGTAAAPGEEGELRIRAPQLTVGYVDPALDAEAFDEQGYFRTGDLAVLGTDGTLTITGRIKDVIIRNMENVSAREVEDHLATLPGLRDWTVVGVPDPVTGERVCAVVVPEGPAAPPTLSEVCAYLVGRGLNTRKLPERLEVLDVLPRNAMGKVGKAALVRRMTGEGER
ncbi:MAG: AMP-binding protein [Pseudonocardia sp.]|nr:AMP-binding protein [Pseudonocardia sp.]